MNKSILANSEKIKRIGVLTSGGDAPGMNAAIRAVIRTGLYYGLEVVGIRAGYEGLINKRLENLNMSSAGNIIQRGGTILQTARSERFRTVEGRQAAYDNIRGEGIDALIVIGGDGTFRGAVDFNKAYDYPIVGIPGTIDNDLYGTDFTIGYDTAINTVIEAVDKIRDTAAAHNRLFFIEVMGRDAGFIAIRSGIACGAEDILIPETKTHIDDLIARLDKGRRQNKTSGIIIVAEGDEAGGAIEIAEQVRKRFNYYETKVTILGHLQRGGSPTCMDRVLASELGYNAVKGVLEGHRGEMVGIIDKKVVFKP
ncbi:MAG: 6-phosphofructokinase, partial [Bacteroidales bacterium]|nr:6-phosphofructokinase [Bacteroidales bacterium]